MKHYSRPTTTVKTLDDTTQVTDDQPLSEVSVDRLIDNGLTVLQREMKNLLSQSARGKLDAASARDLRDTVKLLFELKDRESELLKGKTDEELKAMANGEVDPP